MKSNHSNKNTISQKPSLALKKFQGTPKIILSSDLLKQCRSFHHIVGSDEWSGVLLYKILEGTIKDPENLKLYCIGIYPMNVGNSAYTEFESDPESLIDLCDKYPEYEEGVLSTGLIHSHHRMTTFFSGTDDDELKDNVEAYNAYLSLVVNFEMKPTAKLAFKVKNNINNKYVVKDVRGENIEFNNSSLEEFIGFYDCNIEFEDSENIWYEERITQLKKDKPKVISIVNHHNGGYIYDGGSYGGEENPISSKINVRSFLCKSISLNVSYVGSDLATCINRENSRILQSKEKVTKIKDSYKESIEENLDACMKEAYGGKKISVERQYAIIEEAIKVLKPFSNYMVASEHLDLFEEILNLEEEEKWL